MQFYEWAADHQCQSTSFTQRNPKRARAIFTRRHQEKFAVLIQSVRRRKIPDRALRQIITAAAQNSAAGVFVGKFFGPLPHVANHVLNAERTRPLRMSIHRVRAPQFASLVGCRHQRRIPAVSPRIQSAVRALTGILPLPFVWKPLSCPSRIRARIVQ